MTVGEQVVEHVEGLEQRLAVFLAQDFKQHDLPLEDVVLGLLGAACRLVLLDRWAAGVANPDSLVAQWDAMGPADAERMSERYVELLGRLVRVIDPPDPQEATG